MVTAGSSRIRRAAKIPADKVAAEKEKLAKYTQMLEQVRTELAKLPAE